jgi:hypothetical protein
MNVVRALSNEGVGRLKCYQEVLQHLNTDPEVQRYCNGDTPDIPQLYLRKAARSLGSFHQHLPAGAIYHDQNAYLKASGTPGGVIPIQTRSRSTSEDQSSFVSR